MFYLCALQILSIVRTGYPKSVSICVFGQTYWSFPKCRRLMTKFSDLSMKGGQYNYNVY